MSHCLNHILFSFSSDKNRRTDCDSRRGCAVFFSSDPAVSSSIFFEAEREENLIRNDPDKSEFTSLRATVLLWPWWLGCIETSTCVLLDHNLAHNTETVVPAISTALSPGFVLFGGNSDLRSPNQTQVHPVLFLLRDLRALSGPRGRAFISPSGPLKVNLRSVETLGSVSDSLFRLANTGFWQAVFSSDSMNWSGRDNPLLLNPHTFQNKKAEETQSWLFWRKRSKLSWLLNGNTGWDVYSLNRVQGAERWVYLSAILKFLFLVQMFQFLVKRKFNIHTWKSRIERFFKVFDPEFKLFNVSVKTLENLSIQINA